MSNDATQDDNNWEQAIPGTQDDLDFLQTTAEDLATSRTIDNDVRAEAVMIAIRLVASLAKFGFAQAAEQARDVVATLQQPGLPQPERLQQQVSALRETLAPALEE